MTEPSDKPRDEAKGVGKKARTSLKWTLIGTIGSNIVRLAVIPLLGRLLTPEEFGAVAAAITFIAFAQMLRDIGIGVALVQRKSLTPEQIDAAIGLSMILGLAIGAFVFLAAPLIAQLFDAAELVPMIRVLAGMFVVRAFGSVSRALCERAMQFRALSIIDFVSFVVGSVSSVVLAAMGAGVWSLIAGYLIETAIVTIGVFILQPTRIHFRLEFGKLRELLGFGAGATVADIAQYFANFGDYVVVGSALGKESLGFYMRAYELMRFPSAVFTNVAHYVLFSAFARIQDDRERLGRAFRRGTFLTTAVLLPTSAGVIVAAPELIHVLLGDQWDHVVLPFQILSTCMMARTSWKIGGVLARATGDVYAVAVANIAYAVLILVGATIGAQWGIVGVSIAVAIECTLHYFVYSYLGLRRTTLTWTAFFLVHLEGLIAAAIALAAIIPVTYGLRSLGANDLVVLAGAIAAGAASLVVSVWIGARRGQPDWTWLWEAARERFTRSGRAPGTE